MFPNVLYHCFLKLLHSNFEISNTAIGFTVLRNVTKKIAKKIANLPTKQISPIKVHLRTYLPWEFFLLLIKYNFLKQKLSPSKYTVIIISTIIKLTTYFFLYFSPSSRSPCNLLNAIKFSFCCRAQAAEASCYSNSFLSRSSLVLSILRMGQKPSRVASWKFKNVKLLCSYLLMY